MSSVGSSKSPYKGKNLSVALIVATLVLQVFFFTPMHVISLNFEAFSVPFVDILVIHLAISLALILLAFLVVRILEFHFVTATLAFVSLIAFCESWFFYRFAGHQPFSQQAIDWQSLEWISNLELGVMLVAGVLLLVWRKRVRLLSKLSLGILVLLSIGFVYDTLSKLDTLSPAQQDSGKDADYLDHFYRLSSQRNVIHIVPDQAQGAMLNEILVTDFDRYSGVFDGFTSFTRATGGFEDNYPNVVFNVTGELPDPAFDVVDEQPYTREFVDEALRERSLVTALSNNSFKTFGFQFDSELFCQGPYTACTGSQEQVFTGVPLNNPKWQLAVAVMTSWDLALFRMTPVKLRSIVYDEGDWFTRKLAAFGGSRSSVIDIFTQNMQVEDNPGTYNYFHHAGARPPLLFDRNCRFVGSRAVNSYTQGEQVRCMLGQLAGMVDALKQAGIYDQTMIVVNADSGTTGLPPSLNAHTGNGVSPALMGKANTFFLIKPPGARGPLAFSDYPASIGDVPVTVADALDLKNNFPGRSLFSRGEETQRERLFFTYESDEDALQTMRRLSRYRINGNVFDERAWLLPDTVGEGSYLSKLRVDHPEFPGYSEGFSPVEYHIVPIRWVDGNQARVYLMPPPTGSLKLEFGSYVPKFIRGQSMEIRVDGVMVQTLNHEALSENQHTVVLPADLPRGNLLEIEFTMGKTVNTGEDLRDLSILFSYIGLVPGE